MLPLHKGLYPYGILPTQVPFYPIYGSMERLSLFKSIPKPLGTLADFTPVESILLVTQPPWKTISRFYRALMALGSISFPNFLRKWKHNLRCPLSDDQRAIVLQLAHNSSVSSRIAEVNYRMLSRWHHTPAQLYK